MMMRDLLHLSKNQRLPATLKDLFFNRLEIAGLLTSILKRAIMPVITTPISLAELYARAQALTGLTLGNLASQLNFPLPVATQRIQAKGWMGHLIEYALGANAKSKPEPDFPALGVELKTIPVNAHGVPMESTYLCKVPLPPPIGAQWQDSVVYQKLKHILWIPIITLSRTQPIALRQIGAPCLWQPDAATFAIIRNDWEEFMDIICMGELETITARHGVYLQVRPKAADAKTLCWTISASGEKIQTLPRGFYLRTALTREILETAQKKLHR